MRIGFVIAGDESYGVARMTSSLLGALQKVGVDAFVISMSENACSISLREKGFSVVTIGHTVPPNFGKGPIEALKAFRHVLAYKATMQQRLALVLKDLRLDSVIVRIANLVFLTGKAAKIANVASYWIMPNAVSSRYPLGLNKLVYDLELRRLGVTPIANSRYTQTTLLNLLTPSKVMHLGIDETEFAPASENERINERSAGTLSIGVMARLVEEKGQLRLLEALRDPRLENESIHLHLFGGPLGTDYHALLTKRRVELDLVDRVTFHGPSNNMASAYGLCDITANVRIDAEPFGLSVIESFMMQKPVLAHSLGGPGETVQDGANGWLIDDASSSTIAGGLQRVLNDQPRWGEMGMFARLTAIQEYSASAMARRLLSILTSNDTVVHDGDRQ